MDRDSSGTIDFQEFYTRLTDHRDWLQGRTNARSPPRVRRSPSPTGICDNSEQKDALLRSRKDEHTPKHTGNEYGPKFAKSTPLGRPPYLTEQWMT